MMKRLFIGVAVALVFSLPAFAQIEEGDLHWSRRSEGARGPDAKPLHIDAAIEAYRNAIDADPGNLEARWKLMRAFRFKASYTGKVKEQKQEIYDQAKKAGEEGVAILERLLRNKGVVHPREADEQRVASIARSIPSAGEIYFWDAVSWGEWAQVFGKLAAVRQGAAGRIRREATIALLIDPSIENGGPARVLGRLHNQTPRVPFVTGWASDREAVKFLRESLEQDPRNKLTKVFLAEAMVAERASAQPDAVRVLRDVMHARNDPEWEVEDAAATEDARAMLRDWGEL